MEKFPKVVKKDLKFMDFSRYSNRQKTKMKVGGIVGEIVVDGLDKQTYELLKYGEIVGVGKLGSFGLGKIEVEDLR
nr:CRISPR system precrRNA processing endoribonuclease RAMP protein Cas6 [Nitratiruptor sp. YY09-18]